MIRINLILKNKKLIETLKSELKSFFIQESKIIIEEGLSKEVNNNDIVISFVELKNSDDIKFARKVKDNTINGCIIFISENESLVFESLSVQPLQFIRINNFDEDFKNMLKVLGDYLNNINRTITLKTGLATIRLNINNIIFIESFGHYLIVHSTNGEYKVRGKISNIIDEINNPIMIRVHKSYIINTKFVEEVLSNRLILKSNIDIPIGRSFKETVIKSCL
ncbi:MAG: LytTR family transcriptional regulator [Clostridium baratii]|uniref:LytTr DNA-binding domain protein n=1 Tax=Clostridium baratii str. Sullivan TaxID=1415775 RepID=A0A0A7FW18_9CLOT|nr:LytTR family DNA-binding domain-containing protein [Clostridium baratii]AIY83768.1 lytTr DNA-binding domain protein [Clostridium baratii str. Sullivan]MBS6007951.1 LytTR family transcriptional regulator [Clostridium baratii]MDU1055134.1 LytTR family transcriptional regulator DNA-binding domain-containing protein [Clostridium baratii]MDU4912660.1 LytTR family transcriptional regulator DNA-binding domain-containing protein [Clostridium baratii]CUP80234.1 response regulator receiver protein [C